MSYDITFIKSLGEVRGHDEVVAEGEGSVVGVHLKLEEELARGLGQWEAQQEHVEVVDGVLKLSSGCVLRLVQENDQQVVLRVGKRAQSVKESLTRYLRGVLQLGCLDISQISSVTKPYVDDVDLTEEG